MSESSGDPRPQQVREAFDAFNRGDLQHVIDFLHPEVRCSVSTSLANPGTWQGLEGFFEMVTEWNEAFSETHYEVRAVEALDETFLLAQVLQTSRGRESGVPVEMEPSYLIAIVNGRARTFEIHVGDAEAKASWEAHRVRAK